MKRFAVVLTILIVLLLTACSSELPSNGHTSSPPVTIIFESEEELQALLNAVSLPDAEFNAFMIQNTDTFSYKMIEDKSEAVELSALIQTVGTPVMLNKDLVEGYSFTYKPEKKTYDIIYFVNGTRYRFFYKPFETFADVSDMDAVESYNLDGALLTMYQLEDDKVGNKRMFAELYANGYYIQVIVNYTDINDVDFTPFAWSTDMHYIK